jgi:hypothetical protein
LRAPALAADRPEAPPEVLLLSAKEREAAKRDKRERAVNKSFRFIGPPLIEIAIKS